MTSIESHHIFLSSLDASQSMYCTQIAAEYGHLRLAVACLLQHELAQPRGGCVSTPSQRLCGVSHDVCLPTSKSGIWISANGTSPQVSANAKNQPGTLNLQVFPCSLLLSLILQNRVNVSCQVAHRRSCEASEKSFHTFSPDLAFQQLQGSPHSTPLAFDTVWVKLNETPQGPSACMRCLSTS